MKNMPSDTKQISKNTKDTPCCNSWPAYLARTAPDHPEGYNPHPHHLGHCHQGVVVRWGALLKWLVNCGFLKHVLTKGSLPERLGYSCKAGVCMWDLFKEYIQVGNMHAHCSSGFLNMKLSVAGTVEIYVNMKLGVQTTGRVWQPLEIMLFRSQRLQMLTDLKVQCWA